MREVQRRIVHERSSIRKAMQPIQRVAIVGAGNMGSGIAQKTAQEEFEVQMVDREQQWVDRGQGIISDFLSEAVERRIFSPSQVEAIQGRITGVVGVENTAADTDLVIEAVFEDFDVKTFSQRSGRSYWPSGSFCRAAFLLPPCKKPSRRSYSCCIIES